MADALARNGRSIVLVGMMGAGKSTLGQALAKRLHLPFADADEEIERETGRSIRDIFGKDGEAGFRAIERRAMARLVAGPVSVIAAGGGAFIDEETRTAVLERCTAVWLKADARTLAERLRDSPPRPLLGEGSHEEILRRLAAERDFTYSQAPIHVMSDEQAVQRILDALKQRE